MEEKSLNSIKEQNPIENSQNPLVNLKSVDLSDDHKIGHQKRS